MSQLLKILIQSDEREEFKNFIDQLRCNSESYWLRNQILQEFTKYCEQNNKPPYFFHSSHLGELLHYTHEIILEAENENIWLLLRPQISNQELYCLDRELNSFETIPLQKLLNFQDRFVHHESLNSLLEIDVKPFSTNTPLISDPSKIGNGLEFLNYYLSNQLFDNSNEWLESLFKVLQEHHYNGLSLLLNKNIESSKKLSPQIKKALNLIKNYSEDTLYKDFSEELQELGFEPGWGNNAKTVKKSLELLQYLIESQNHGILQTFLNHIPLVFSVILVSIHGWLAQENVLGKRETAGQIVYVLNQARSLENQLQEHLKLSGLDTFNIKPKVIVLTRLIPNAENTTCNQRLEAIQDTENAWILRVPFVDSNNKIIPHWISKYKIWSYLERFALDAEKEIIAELKEKPDLIIGNYTDGNLVAFLLAKQLKVIHCNIAHSLEKPKHLFSNLYWEELENKYNFSLQFTADLITMNGADFIINSTYQEIRGNPECMGDYESYKYFTMPKLYHVVDGIELSSPKFNVIPPGVNQEIFFPYYEKEKRNHQLTNSVKQLLFLDKNPDILGYLDEPNKTPLLAIAPISSVKNLSGLVECFARNLPLQKKANLIILTSQISVKELTTDEQKEEINRIHQLIDQYSILNKIRWVGIRLTTEEVGEVYRIVADKKGIFVHPALFEAFGLTVIEAMVCGIPTFATQFGGPLEIIQNYKNGFHINPTNLLETATKLTEFISKCEQQSSYWEEISEAGIKRVKEKYNWRSHSEKLILLTKIYRFWNIVSPENRKALLRYLEALFYLIYQPKANKLLP